MTSALVAAWLSVPAFAGVTVSSAAIEVSISAPKGRAVFHAVESLLLPLGEGLEDHHPLGGHAAAGAFEDRQCILLLHSVAGSCGYL